LTLVRRGTISATSSDGSGPKDSAAFSAIKTASSFLVARVRDRRKDILRQRVAIAITDADVGGTKDSAALASAVDVTASEIISQIREKRTDNFRGATVDFLSSTVVRATFNPPAAGDTIDLDVQVIEKKARRGATLRLLSTTQVRMEWDGELTAGETIDSAFDVYDLDDVGDELLELDYKLLRLLGFSGENSIEDGLKYDQAGNPILIRIRTFDTKANALAAVKDIPDGDPLETGELSRVLSTLTWSVATNRPSSIVTVLLDEAATPGIS
jgi:hypothetical protein